MDSPKPKSILLSNFTYDKNQQAYAGGTGDIIPSPDFQHLHLNQHRVDSIEMGSLGKESPFASAYAPVIYNDTCSQVSEDCNSNVAL